jgi:cytochrome c5
MVTLTCGHSDEAQRSATNCELNRAISTGGRALPRIAVVSKKFENNSVTKCHHGGLVGGPKGGRWVDARWGCEIATSGGLRESSLRREIRVSKIQAS